jgi:hypothetical protein
MRFSIMKALVGGGIQRKQRTGMIVNATTTSRARQRNRRSRENLALLDTMAEVIEVAVFGSEWTHRYARSNSHAIPSLGASQDERHPWPEGRVRETGRLFILKARPPSPKAHPEEDVAFSSQVEFASRLNPE